LTAETAIEDGKNLKSCERFLQKNTPYPHIVDKTFSDVPDLRQSISLKLAPEREYFFGERPEHKIPKALSRVPLEIDSSDRFFSRAAPRLWPSKRVFCSMNE
jgi:hypothetical protein